MVPWSNLRIRAQNACRDTKDLLPPADSQRVSCVLLSAPIRLRLRTAAYRDSKL